MSERLVHIVDGAEVLADAGHLTLVCVLTGFGEHFGVVDDVHESVGHGATLVTR